MKPGCRARTILGKPCTAPRLHGSKWCLHHDPAKAALRAAARLAGGRARAQSMNRAAAGGAAPVERGPVEAPRPAWWGLSSPADVARALAHVVTSVLDGAIEARSANAATAGLNAILGALREDQIESRLEAVERSLDIGKGARHGPTG
jgi:hypothetical protein